MQIHTWSGHVFSNPDTLCYNCDQKSKSQHHQPCILLLSVLGLTTEKKSHQLSVRRRFCNSNWFFPVTSDLWQEITAKVSQWTHSGLTTNSKNWWERWQQEHQLYETQYINLRSCLKLLDANASFSDFTIDHVQNWISGANL